MWQIWTNQLLPKALKSCPKSNKSPNLVTLLESLLGSSAPQLVERLLPTPEIRGSNPVIGNFY